MLNPAQSGQSCASGKRRRLDLTRANETLKEELKRHQMKLLKIVQDNYFLHERLLPHEKKQQDSGGVKLSLIHI